MREMASSVRRSDERSIDSRDLIDHSVARLEGERRHGTGRQLASERLDEGVEAEVLAVRLDMMRPDFRSMSTLRLSIPTLRPMTMSAFARSVIGPSSGQRTCASVTGCHARRSGGKHSTNCVTRAIALPAQVGLVAGGQGGDPVADAAVVVGESGEGVVDELRRRRLAAPVELQLDGPVGDLAARDGRATRRTARRRGSASRTPAPRRRCAC